MTDSTGTLTLVEFLLARIAEDEALAQEVARRVRYMPPRTAGGMGDTGIVGFPFRRALAECEAKRRIIGDLESMYMRVRGDGVVSDGHFVLRAIALPYADHPDYREGWKP